MSAPPDHTASLMGMPVTLLPEPQPGHERLCKPGEVFTVDCQMYCYASEWDAIKREMGGKP